jgi:guanylate kinase
MSTSLNNRAILDKIKILLTNYIPKDNIIGELNRLQLIMLVAPTASGRNSVINCLLEKGNYHYIISDTTRKPRMNNGKLEQNGQVYWFKNINSFHKSVQNGEYIEAAVIHNQQASGIHISEIRKAHNEHKHAITDIDTVGCNSIMKISKNTLPIFLLPPSFEVWMERLKGRGFLADDELKRRLDSAKKELDYALSTGYFTFIINDSLEETVIKIDELVNSKILLENQNSSKKLVKELLRNLN